MHVFDNQMGGGFVKFKVRRDKIIIANMIRVLTICPKYGKKYMIKKNLWAAAQSAAM